MFPLSSSAIKKVCPGAKLYDLPSPKFWRGQQNNNCWPHLAVESFDGQKIVILLIRQYANQRGTTFWFATARLQYETTQDGWEKQLVSFLESHAWDFPEGGKYAIAYGPDDAP